MTITLIRHGQTLANEQRLYGGKTDLDLSPAGQQEILKLKARGYYPPLTGRCVTGTLKRTRQTLRLIYPDAAYQTTPAFNEMDFGVFEMKGHETLMDSMDYIDWISDESGLTPCPQGENRVQFQRRVLDAFEPLLQEEQDVTLVVHGGVIATILLRLFPKRGLTFYDVQPRPAHGFTVTVENGQAADYRPL